MSMVADIAGLSTAMSTAKLQADVSTKVLKLVNQQQGQVVSKLLESAMENIQAIATQFAEDVGNNIDTQA
jgi:hypothetical protein